MQSPLDNQLKASNLRVQHHSAQPEKIPNNNNNNNNNNNMWNQAVHTDREVTTNRPDIINKKKRKHAH